MCNGRWARVNVLTMERLSPSWLCDWSLALGFRNVSELVNQAQGDGRWWWWLLWLLLEMWVEYSVKGLFELVA